MIYCTCMESRNWPIIGQSKALNFFDKLLNFEEITPGRLGGSFILAGGESLGKTTALELFICKLLKISNFEIVNSDIARLEPGEGSREIGVDQVREFSGRIALSAFGSHYRIGIISSAESLSIEAANALLKTLEDARDQVIIFLLTTTLDKLPTTVRSRSQIITFSSVGVDIMYEWLIQTVKVTRPQAKNFSRLAAGRPGVAWSLAKDKKLLEERLSPMRLFCQALTISLQERWQLAGKLIGSLKGTEAVEAAKQTILSWRLGLRDMLLLYLNRPELVVHTILEEDLRNALRRLTPTDLRRLDIKLIRSLDYLQANVNPKLVLEQVMLNII